MGSQSRSSISVRYKTRKRLTHSLKDGHNEQNLANLLRQAWIGRGRKNNNADSRHSHTCPSPDLKWFKGSILSENRDTYSIRGWLNRVSKPVIEEEDQGKELTGLSPELGSSAGSSTSDGDKLNLGEKEDEELTYIVYITDFDTATTQTLQNVRCNISGDGYRLTNDDDFYLTANCLKGVKADKAIMSTLGWKLTNQRMFVYKGIIECNYNDDIFPLETQSYRGWWCM